MGKINIIVTYEEDGEKTKMVDYSYEDETEDVEMEINPALDEFVSDWLHEAAEDILDGCRAQVH
ncbi:hypothetical protein [Leclercia sp.]|uniref:hypothetical protein n=1 Tax=Leclercia sp. TaxID=1898428 RepID=UPI0028AF335D|nr:hypothetical protein [Leclercia sp.]